MIVGNKEQKILKKIRRYGQLSAPEIKRKTKSNHTPYNSINRLISKGLIKKVKRYDIKDSRTNIFYILTSKGLKTTEEKYINKKPKQKLPSNAPIGTRKKQIIQSTNGRREITFEKAKVGGGFGSWKIVSNKKI